MTTKKSRQHTTSNISGLRLIKKYPNRRLYDTAKRRYITLNDIKQYVLDQIEFRIIDTQTEADLTKLTLLQIITEHEAGTSAFFTTELLQQIIRLYNNNLQSIFGQYFEQMLLQLIQHKDLWVKGFEKYQQDTPKSSKIEAFNPFSTFQEFTQIQQEFWDKFMKKVK